MLFWAATNYDGRTNAGWLDIFIWLSRPSWCPAHIGLHDTQLAALKTLLLFKDRCFDQHFGLSQVKDQIVGLNFCLCTVKVFSEQYAVVWTSLSFDSVTYLVRHQRQIWMCITSPFWACRAGIPLHLSTSEVFYTSPWTWPKKQTALKIRDTFSDPTGPLCRWDYVRTMFFDALSTFFSKVFFFFSILLFISLQSIFILSSTLCYP